MLYTSTRQHLVIIAVHQIINASYFVREFKPKVVYQVYASEFFTKSMWEVKLIYFKIQICKNVSNLRNCIFHELIHSRT